MKRLWIGIVLAALAASGAWADPGAEMKEGQWDLTIETEIPGMPMKMPPLTQRQCITRNNPVPENKAASKECKMTDMKSSGNTVSWTIKCDPPEGPITGNGTVTYQGNKMNGAMVMETQGMKMNYRLSGQYIGPCPK